MKNRDRNDFNPFSDKMPYDQHSQTYNANEKIRKQKSKAQQDFKRKYGSV